MTKPGPVEASVLVMSRNPAPDSLYPNRLLVSASPGRPSMLLATSLPETGRDRYSGKRQAQISPVVFHTDLGILIPTVDQLRDKAAIGALESHASDARFIAPRPDPDRSRPDELAEVGKSVVDAGIGDLLGIAIDYDYRVLYVVVGIVVDG